MPAAALDCERDEALRLDDAHRLLSVTTNQKRCPWVGEWERLAEAPYPFETRVADDASDADLVGGLIQGDAGPGLGSTTSSSSSSPSHSLCVEFVSVQLGSAHKPTF